MSSEARILTEYGDTVTIRFTRAGPDGSAEGLTVGDQLDGAFDAVHCTYAVDGDPSHIDRDDPDVKRYLVVVKAGVIERAIRQCMTLTDPPRWWPSPEAVRAEVWGEYASWYSIYRRHGIPASFWEVVPESVYKAGTSVARHDGMDALALLQQLQQQQQVRPEGLFTQEDFEELLRQTIRVVNPPTLVTDEAADFTAEMTERVIRGLGIPPADVLRGETEPGVVPRDRYTGSTYLQQLQQQQQVRPEGLFTPEDIRRATREDRLDVSADRGESVQRLGVPVPRGGRAARFETELQQIPMTISYETRLRRHQTSPSVRGWDLGEQPDRTTQPNGDDDDGRETAPAPRRPG